MDRRIPVPALESAIGGPSGMTALSLAGVTLAIVDTAPGGAPSAHRECAVAVRTLAVH
jgi:hypothetical protein